MQTLSNLKDTHRQPAKFKRVGRGPGSGLGKTCGRGQKGQGARSGYKRRHGNEGGQVRLYMKLPTRGFTNGRFRKRLDAINLDTIDRLCSDGETVNIESLRKHGYISGKCHGLKILGNGEITKKVTIEADAISAGAKEKLDAAKISYSLTPGKASE